MGGAGAAGEGPGPPLFTGIIIDVGTLEDVRRAAHGATLVVRPTRPLEAKESDSVAVNGVCLTVTGTNGGLLEFDTVAETLSRSTLGSLGRGDRLNMELALMPGDRLGGHFVQGHVDAVGRIRSVSSAVADRRVTVEAPAEAMPFIVEKGSIAIDGISLTVADATPDSFTVSVIPFTWDATNLRDRKPGDQVNLETDILARYVARLLPGGSGGLSEKGLREAGF